MIPKIIHYCWFGSNKKTEIFEQCLISWKKYCPDYKIIEWNELNSLKFSNSFYKNALRKKKYAFVSDYIRTKVLYEYGGIYLDTDMLLLKPIDELLKYNFFSGFEVKDRVAFGLFGGVAKHHFFSKMLAFYENNYFDEFNPPIITHTFKDLINFKNLNKNEILLAPKYFYPLTYQDREKDYKLFISHETLAVHLWDHSWEIEIKKGYFFILKNMRTVCKDYLFYGYSFIFLKKYFLESIKNLYRLTKYKTF